MYKAQQGGAENANANPNNAGQAGQPNGENVTDVDFEEVK
jgi:hypothetical protein